MTPTPGSKREVAQLAWPLGVSMLSLTFKGLADTVMVGHLGANELAGVGFGGVVAFLVIALGMGTLRGVKPMVSQHVGAGDEKTAFQFGVQGVWLAVMFGLGGLLLASPLAHTIGLLSGGHMSEAVLDNSKDYFSLRVGLSGTYLLTLGLGEFLRATGRQRLPMKTDLVSQPLNILFNYMLIYGKFGAPELGVRGAAIGTGLADGLAFVVLLYLAGRSRRGPVGLKALLLIPEKFKRLLFFGFPMGLQFMVEVGSFTFITAWIGSLGAVSLAAHQIAIQVLHVSFLPGIAIGDAASILVGRAVGAVNWTLARQTVRSTLTLTVALMLSIGLLLVLFARPISALFIHDPDPSITAEVIDVGKQLLWVSALWQFFDALQIVYRMSLRGAGDNKWVAWVGISVSWLIAVPLAWVAIFLLHLSVVGVWLVWLVELALGAWIFHRRWAGDVWKSKRLVQDAPIQP